MTQPCPAHSGHVISLTTSTTDAGSMATVVSYGGDDVIHIWQLETNGQKDIVLKNTGTVVPSSSPVCMALMETRLCVAVATNHQILVYDLNQKNQSWQHISLGSWSGLSPILHQPDDDHKDQVLAVTASPHLLLFASSGKDGKVKVWNQNNQLVADIHLGSDHELSAVCFANNCGDLLIGFQHQICLVKAELFLCSPNQQETAGGSEEEKVDTLIPFDPDLEFWSVFDSTPNVLLRPLLTPSYVHFLLLFLFLLDFHTLCSYSSCSCPLFHPLCSGMIQQRSQHSQSCKSIDFYSSSNSKSMNH